mgnify:CR=1 FL=1
MGNDFYDSRRPGTGVNYIPDAPREGQKEWRTAEDRKRVQFTDTCELLYLGKHFRGDGGIFLHPYGEKGNRDRIPYITLNLLAKCSRVYADLLASDVSVDAQDEMAKAVLDKVEFGLPLWEAILMASISGFVGLQPVEMANGWSWMMVDSRNLYLEWDKATKKLAKVRKCVVFEGVQVSLQSKIDMLYEETHTAGLIETRLYWIDGEKIVEELPLDSYQVVDPEAFLVERIETGLPGLAISILVNDSVAGHIQSDYTASAIGLQEALNARVTRNERILTIHSDPKLVAPRTALKKDPETGELLWASFNSEILFVDQAEGIQPYNYLTWDGQITAAENSKRMLKSELLAELDVAPQFLGDTELVGGTTADTASKLRQMLHSTIKRATRKRGFLDIALRGLIGNILTLSGMPDAEFSIDYGEFIEMSREEILAEVLQRKQNKLIDTVSALEWLDNLSHEDAVDVTAAINAEEQNAVGSMFPPTRYNLGQEQPNGL